jgi:hypothetical protein
VKKNDNNKSSNSNNTDTATVEEKSSTKRKLDDASALTEFVQVSKGKKLKAWQNEIEFPLATTTSTIVNDNNDTESTKAIKSKPMDNNTPSTAVVFDDKKSDLDYLKSRMVSNDTNDDDQQIDGNDNNNDDDNRTTTTTDAAVDNARLYVTNLPFVTTPEELRQHFERVM